MYDHDQYNRLYHELLLLPFVDDQVMMQSHGMMRVQSCLCLRYYTISGGTLVVE